MIKYTLNALDNLQDIQSYLEETAPEYAAQTVGGLMDTVDTLSYLPHRGVPMPELLEEGGDVRELYHRPYRIVYLLEGTDVIVLAVIHMKQRRVLLVARDDS